MSPATRHSFTQRGLQLSYLDSAPGDKERPVVLLLHGFPDQALMWTAQIRSLHAAGYRCIAPDTLGCGESAMGARLRDYHCLRIAEDHIALLDHLGLDSAHVVGHDWGAVLAWLLAGHYPERSRSLVAFSVGHPTAYARAGLRQKLLGWYTYLFQLGGLAEKLLLGNGPLRLQQVFRSHPDMDEVIGRLRAPGRLTAALRIYRAAIVPVLLRRQPAVYAPTLGVWSEEDRFLTESQMQASQRYCQGPWTYQRLSGHHWIPLEQPERCSQLILEHIQALAD